jgi:hypothetical protein
MIKWHILAIKGEILRLIFVRMAGTDLQHDLQHELQHDLKKLKNHRLFEPSVQSIIGAEDNRAAAVAALSGIQSSPQVRPLPEQTRFAHHTLTACVLPPHPAEIQEDGGVWAGCFDTEKAVEP